MLEKTMSLKLSTGEEIVCKCELPSEGVFYRITKPVVIIPDGNGGITFMPWMFTVGKIAELNETISINEDHVIACVKTSPQFKEMYESFTSSIIKVKPTGLIQ